MTRKGQQTETRQQRISRQNRWGMVILGVSITGFLGVGGYVVAHQAVARDKTTGCQVGQLDADVRAVVDRTDPISKQQQALLKASLEQLADSVPIEGRLTLYPFDGKGDEVPTPVLQRCKLPGADDVNPLLVTATRAAKAQAKTFTLPVAEKIAELTEIKSAEQTHLVAYLAVLGGSMNYGKRAGRRVLRIYGDMAEFHPDAALIGKRAMEPKAFAAYAKQKLGSKLDGISIEVVQIPSASTPPAVAKRIRDAWSETFSALGVSFTWNTL